MTAPSHLDTDAAPTSRTPSARWARRCREAGRQGVGACENRRLGVAARTGGRYTGPHGLSGNGLNAWRGRGAEASTPKRRGAGRSPRDARHRGAEPNWGEDYCAG